MGLARLKGTQTRNAPVKSHPVMVNEKQKNMHDKSHRLVVTKAGSRRTVGLGSVWSVWLLAGWLFGLAVPVSSFELRPRYNNSLDYFALEEEESFRFGHFCHQYNWFGPHGSATTRVPWSCLREPSTAAAEQLATGAARAEWLDALNNLGLGFRGKEKFWEWWVTTCEFFPSPSLSFLTALVVFGISGFCGLSLYGFFMTHCHVKGVGRRCGGRNFQNKFPSGSFRSVFCTECRKAGRQRLSSRGIQYRFRFRRKLHQLKGWPPFSQREPALRRLVFNFGAVPLRPSCHHPLPDMDLFVGGAGGAASSNRKRTESDENGLANALVTFLEQWQQPAPPKKRKTDLGKDQNETGKGKGATSSQSQPQPSRTKRFRPYPQSDSDTSRKWTKGFSKSEQSEPEKPGPADKSLAKKLIKLLKQCMNTGKTDAEIVSLVQKEVSPSGLEPKPVPQDMPAPSGGTKPPKNGKGKGNKQNIGEPGKNKQRSDTSLPSQVSALKPNEWTLTPKLCHFSKWQHVLREGKGDEVNVVEVNSVEQLRECQTICEAFDLHAGLTLLFTGGDLSRAGKEWTQTRVSLLRNRKMTIEPVGLLRLTDSTSCPWIAPATKVPKDKLPVSTKVLVRVVAPARYRKFHLSKNQDEPNSIVSSLALQSGCPVAPLTGGKWSKQICDKQKKQDEQLVGYIRLQDSEAAKVLKVSGVNGIFVNLQTKQETKPNIFWIKRHELETDENYARRCYNLSNERSQPCILRNGGGSDIGFLKKNLRFG